MSDDDQPAPLDAAAAFLKEFGWTDEEIAAIEDEGEDE